MKKQKEIGEEIAGYGILITRTDGTHFLASGAELGCFIARKRPDAVERKRYLGEHMDIRRMKVVKVLASWAVIP